MLARRLLWQGFIAAFLRAQLSEQQTVYVAIDRTGWREVNLLMISRRINHRHYSTLGFGEFEAAQRFCQAVHEVGNFLRPRSQMAEFVYLSDHRSRSIKRVEELEVLF